MRIFLSDDEIRAAWRRWKEGGRKDMVSWLDVGCIEIEPGRYVTAVIELHPADVGEAKPSA